MQLMSRILHMPFPWNLWVMILGGVNCIGGLYFFQFTEGKFAIGAMMGAMVVMLLIFNRFGFVRLLGLGHILFWIPFLAWSVWRFQFNFESEQLKWWLVTVNVFNGASLLIDFADVWRFARGETEKMF